MNEFEKRKKLLMENTAGRNVSSEDILDPNVDLYSNRAIANLILNRHVSEANKRIRHTANWFEHPHPKGRNKYGECDFAAIKLCRAYYLFKNDPKSITMNLKTTLIYSLCSLPLWTACSSSSEDEEKENPNFLFILADDLGWKDLECYGSSFYDTPNLDQLATEGMRFTNAYAACPVSSPTRASIMSGKYPARMNTTDWFGAPQPEEVKNHWTGQLPLIPASYQEKLPLSEVTIAEALKKAEYKTWYLGKWHLGEKKYYPENQGFDVNIGGYYRGSPGYYNDYKPEKDLWIGESGYFSPHKIPTIEDGPEGEYLPDRLTSEALKLMEQNKDSSFFMFMSYYLVHIPLATKDQLFEKYQQKAKNLGLDEKKEFIRNKPWMEELPVRKPDRPWRLRIKQGQPQYAGMVYSLDKNIGRLLDKLEELDIADNTIVIFVSDNGGLSTAEGSSTSNLPLKGGKGWLYEGGIRVPMIIKWPGVTQPGSVSNTPVTSTDFYPTILQMADIPKRKQQQRDGVSLVPLLKQSGPLERDALYWHYPHYGNQGGRPGAAIRQGKYKLIEWYEENRVELYNLNKDIEEDHNLVKQMPDKAGKMQQKLNQWQQKVDAKLPRPNPNAQ